jgi:tRNA modification GTPase
MSAPERSENSPPAARIVPRETVAAIATAPGRAGIGVVRISGKGLSGLASTLSGHLPAPRHATLATFREADGQVIDQGITLFFPAPHSYTGEDVLELQGHGGMAVLQRLLQRCLALGCRLAQPGEFTQRAFLNHKLDLAQAEAVADLIDASSLEAAQSAARSLVGDFSRRVHAIVEELIGLRTHVEACIDFPEEEIDPADRQVQQEKLKHLRALLADLLAAAKQGAVLRDGLTVVIVGRPNVGKSSLLNRLAGEDVAIVTPIAGTTRDQVRVTINLDGVPIHLIDTAGLRETEDPVERIGIERTWVAIGRAGAALLIAEAGEMIGPQEAEILSKLPPALPTAWVYNKIDIHGQPADCRLDGAQTTIRLSALRGEGVEHVRRWLLETAGWQPTGGGVFMARERHLVALRDATQHLDAAAKIDHQYELFAEELRLAQRALASITGEFTADDLLGEIFGTFCIGK